MVAGSLTMAGLLLVAGAAAPDEFPLNQRDLQIPIRVNPARKQDISKLLLVVSRDRGQTWQPAAVATPDQEAFPYTAPADGPYWFTVCAVDQNGKQDPADPRTVPAAQYQKVLIDTVRPELRIVSAERLGDDVMVRWDLREENLAPDGLKLEYRPADAAAGGWQPVPLDPSLGRVTFRPTTPGALALRMQAADLAQNVATAQAEAPAGAGAGVVTTQARENKDWSPNPVKTVSRPLDGAPALELPPAGGGTGWNNPPSAEAPRQGDKETRRQGDANPSGPQPVASSQGGPPAAAPPAAPPSQARPARGTLPPLQMVNNRQVTIEYEVAKYGLSGVGSVELYLTRDDGRSWQKYAGEQQVLNPPAPVMDAKEPLAPLRQALTAVLPGEGVYGFCLVVKSGVGLGKPPPQNGDPPQMRVQVDETMPKADLYAPVPDPARRDAVLLSWVASDQNLTATPVTLEWADREGGEWHPVAPGELPNTGRYSWQVPRNVPARVYLRLSVRDTAGNVAVAQTSQPILIDLTEPEATPIGLKVSR